MPHQRSICHARNSSIDVESGELGADGFIDPITDGALSVLRELGMVAGEFVVLYESVYLRQGTSIQRIRRYL